MKKLVTFEQAKILKVLGFKEEVLNYYDNYGDCKESFHIDSESPVTLDQLLFSFNTDKWYGYPSDSVSAPTISEALDWVREVKMVSCGVYPIDNKYYRYRYIPIGISDIRIISSPSMESYSLAEFALLDEVLTYLEKKEE